VKLVVGLGNPGPRYAASRHNVGFRVVEHLARSRGLHLDTPRFAGRYAEGVLDPEAPAERLGLLEPETFMNRSGDAVAQALDALPGVDPARDLVVVYDDLDLPLGRLRVRPRGGAGGHRGLADVIERLGSREFPRVRFGIGRPTADPSGERRGPVVDFVLDAFSAEEERVLSERIPVAAEAVVSALCEGVATAMDRFNRAPDAPSGD
jgi:PTH1 family peptidyl-tRNA hydrolase